MIRPYDYSGVSRGADGILRYDNLHNSLVEMLRATVDQSPNNEAVVELGGERVNYRQLWDRAARVAGGLKAMGVERGDRVAGGPGGAGAGVAGIRPSAADGRAAAALEFAAAPHGCDRGDARYALLGAQQSRSCAFGARPALG